MTLTLRCKELSFSEDRYEEPCAVVLYNSLVWLYCRTALCGCIVDTPEIVKHFYEVKKGTRLYLWRKNAQNVIVVFNVKYQA
jgi:hypothetical protein